MEKNSLDASIFLCSSPIHDSNIQYFTGFQQTRFWAFSCLVITPEKSLLIPSRLEYDRALREAEADEIINIKDYDNSLTKILKEKLRDEKKIGIIESIFPYRLTRKLKNKEFRNVSDITEELRSIKTQGEIELIKKSCKIANHGVKVVQENLSKNITEKEIAIIIEQELIRKGADEISFPTIVTSGKRSAYVHPEPSFSEKKIQEGLGLIDFGARYKGYCSDITVPFSIGNLSKKQKEIVNTVQKTYEKSIESLEIGKPTWKIYDITEKITEGDGFEAKHSLGHGLGLDVHESPNLSPKPKTEDGLKGWEETLLKENMVFTIEPGIYVPEIGGSRLENDVLMVKNGPEILTKSEFIEL
ncbi:MAG: M24 family metallopeptidase [Candidatus Aenigmarchaeota archaeon]|nr:M24 family metallopeptidase [Candidatus Aenigmarchaeota archaeon]